MNKMNITAAALKLYKPPFEFRSGYIWDADGSMVADQGATEAVLRIRGWGHIQYLKEFKPEDLQDEVGRLCAEAMTNFWLSPPKED